MGPALTSSNVADTPTPTDSMHAPTQSPSATSWPPTVQMAFAPARDGVTAQAKTWQLAHTHYENFSVVSALLPRRLRQDFCNIYAFCRIADDLGDEVSDRDVSLRFLDRFRRATLEMYAGNAATVVFRALETTVAKYDIPAKPFLDLIDAFEQDQRVDRYQTYSDLLDYCRRSADPVGRLVLYVGGYRDETRQQLSDATCTALQLVNFWQDVSRDLSDRNRIYLPRETMDQFKVTEQQLHTRRCDDAYRQCIKFEIDRAQALFVRGEQLLPLLNQAIRPQVSLFGQGGRAILGAIRRANYDTLTSRPVVSRWQKGQLVLRGLAGRFGQILSFEGNR